jgi:hypothetical protein
MDFGASLPAPAGDSNQRRKLVRPWPELKMCREEQLPFCR